MKFRKKPLVIDAVPLKWDRWSDVCELGDVGFFSEGKAEGCFVDAKGHPTDDHNGRIGLRIPTREGEIIAVEGDWIIRGVKGELYPCKPDVFEASYERVVPGALQELQQMVDTMRATAAPEVVTTWEDKPLPEDEAIAEAHPFKTGDHGRYAEARRLVTARHSKGKLIELVNWLLKRVDDAKEAH